MTTMDWTTPSTLSDVGRVQPGFADKVALSDGALQLSYAQLDRQIDAAHGVYAGLGLTPGDRVVLLLPASTSFVAVYFGAHRAGLILIPLNPLLGPDEIGFILSTMRPALVVADTDAPFPVMAALDDLVATVDPAPRLVRIADFVASMANAPADCPAVVRHPDDEALILFTSGTSGRPKGASHREGALITNGRHSNGVLGIGPDDVLLCPLPLSHVFGQIVLMLGGLMAGGEVVIVARPSPDAVLAAMIDRQASILAAVPTIFAALAEKGRSDSDAGRAASRLRFAFAGGAPLPPATGEAFRASFGIPVHQGYGMTEVACCIALESHVLPPSGGVGRLCTTLDHRIVPISADTPDEGELEIAGPNVMRGYYVDGQLQPRRDAQWFPTGDIVRRDGDGTIFLFDRKKEMIIRNGYNVYPSEVEAALASHPAVLLAAVIGVEDATVWQEVAAFVSLREGAAVAPVELANWCRARIALYKYPRLVAIMEQLPTNATGKILKRALDHALLQPVDSV